MPVSVALLITGVVIVIAVAAGLVIRAQEGRRRTGGHMHLRTEDLSGRPLAPSATLVQFSTVMCARCPQTRRLLGAIAREHEGVEHLEIDLTERNDLAARYRVLQTPTTFLVDASGAVLSRWGGIPDRRTIDQELASLLTRHPQEQS